MKKGDIAPDFTLLSTDGEQVNLYTTLEQTQVVLFFYLKAFTPLCISEACSFQSQLPAYQSVDAKVFGISPDSESVARRFRKAFGLEYALLLDIGNKVREAYRIPRLMGLLPGRSTYVISRDRRIAGMTHANAGSRVHVEESLQFLRS